MLISIIIYVDHSDHSRMRCYVFHILCYATDICQDNTDIHSHEIVLAAGINFRRHLDLFQTPM